MKKLIALVLTMTMLFAVSATMNVFAADEPTFVVNNVSGKPGDTVEVTVSTANNSGIIGLRVYVNYDKDVLELVSATAGANFADTSFGPLTSPFKVIWDGSLNPNSTTNDVVATLTFTIKDTAAGTSAITLTYDEDDVFDSNYDNVYFAVTNGSVTVEADEPIDFVAATENKGANIRVESATLPAGLRFATTITKANLDIEGTYAYADDAEIIFGVFMLPKDLLTSTGYATLQELIESGEDNTVLDVVAKRIYEQDETTLTYTAVLTGIPEDDWNTVVYAVPYALKGGEYYFGEQTSKSYYDVAKSARETTYSAANIAKITDSTEKAAAQAIAKKLDAIINKVDNKGWIDGWY